MEQKDSEEIPMEQSQYGVYADFYTVRFMIQKYHFSLIEMFRKYSELRKFGKNNKKLKLYIQTIVETMSFLLRNYKSIKDSKEKILFRNMEDDTKEEKSLSDIFDLIKEFSVSYKEMNDSALASSILAIEKSLMVLGVSDIEKEKSDPRTAVMRGY